MELRDRVRRLQRKSPKGGVSFELNDGRKYRYVDEDGFELYRHAASCARADYKRKPRPDVPEVFHAVANARNRAQAVEQLYPDWTLKRPFCPYDLEVLVRDGEIVPEQFAPSYEPVLAAGEEE
jgi:hypothetical protein